MPGERSTHALRADHGDIETIVAVLLEVSTRLEADVRVPEDDLAEIVHFLDVFVGTHQSKEETVLFPVLAEFGVPGEEGPVAIMRAEHQLERDYMDGMADAVTRYAHGNGASGSTLAQYARDVAQAIARDMTQEDEVLYPLAERRIPESRDKGIGLQFDEVEAHLLGEKRHEPFHELAQRLARAYLN